MKRCPQCLFIYPDTDLVCDFDQSALVIAAESEIAAITNTPERPALSDLAATHSRKFEERRSKKALPIAAAVGITFGILIVSVYLALSRQLNRLSTPQPTAPSTVNQIVIPTPSPVPSPSITESPSPEPTIAPKPADSNVKATAHAATSNGPVSTETRSVTQGNAKSVIVLSSGGKVEADEVWRTKDGVWYRRDGVVTLLKKNRVKAIVKD